MDTKQIERSFFTWHRQLYNWVLSFAHSRHATTALFFLSVIEACFFIIAPDILMIALALEKPSKTWFYATVITIGSILGGLIGYLIGSQLWHLLAPLFFQFIFSEATFSQIETLYRNWDFWAIFLGAFTPLPYKVFAISAGVFNISLPMFVLAATIGRGMRFFLVASLLAFYGPSIKIFIDKYFNWLSIALVLILVSTFLLLRLLLS
jgi:membrane protein YqaA with SNARE-associated domain